ncbi:putative glycosyltransferase [Phycisphaera mikurensis NBRC 102666]|uniref:Putative glycosyltransferase n=2 Tax=Phycisphaera TaxID=666508 RepID=I0IJ90_PHYMF|nr:putative glycosyltransferase [Phycisphaera mikurensis NBRC 102666]
MPEPPATPTWAEGVQPAEDAAGPPPDVSVLMPVHNGEAFLAEVLASVLGQRGCRFELVAIDDASSDGTTAMLRAAAEADPRVRVLRFDRNVDICHGLNAGMSVARSPWIARCDADDVMLPGRLASQLAFAGSTGAVAMGAFVELIDRRGRRLRDLEVPLTHEEIEGGLLRGVCTLQHTAMLFHRETAMRLGGYDPAFASAEDLHLWLRMAEVGRLANQPEVLQRYRYFSESMSGSRREEQFENTKRAALEACARRGISPVSVPREHWRPAQDRNSRYEALLQMGWWASTSGERRTGFSYACACLKQRPADRRAWALLRSALCPGGPPAAPKQPIPTPTRKALAVGGA